MTRAGQQDTALRGQHLPGQHLPGEHLLGQLLPERLDMTARHRSSFGFNFSRT